MWCGSISAYCEDDKHTNSDGGKERRCSFLEPASPVGAHAGIVAWHGLEISVEGALKAEWRLGSKAGWWWCQAWSAAVFLGSPDGIRTRATAFDFWMRLCGVPHPPLEQAVQFHGAPELGARRSACHVIKSMYCGRAFIA
jgi:hypothetical protein